VPATLLWRAAHRRHRFEPLARAPRASSVPQSAQRGRRCSASQQDRQTFARPL